MKSIVFSSISWDAYKSRNILKSEYRAFKDFIEAIPIENVTLKIKSACRCSNSSAKEYLDEFLTIAWKYVDGDSLEDEIVRSAFFANPALQERTKALIRTDWEKENESLLSVAQRKLDSLEAELAFASANLSKMQEAMKKTQLEDERLTSTIAEKEKLATDVEVAVAKRIQEARENAADFIANMAFVGGHPIQVAAAESHAAVETSPKPIISTYHTFPSCKDRNDLETHHSWADVINTSAFELEDAGVAEKYKDALAAFLCAAYIEKEPILLVGPNAIDIAQAFCAAVRGHAHGMLCCEGVYSNQAITDIGKDDEDIVIINNLLASSWMNRLPEILSQKEIFYIVTHPYAEDIQVEPNSLYGFMLPLFTEFFVDKKATGKYGGGYFADDFKSYSASKGAHRELRILSRFALSTLVRNRINNLVTTMRSIYPATNTDEEFLFAVLPIAYSTLAINKLREIITDPQKGIAISASLKRDLQYVIGESE